MNPLPKNLFVAMMLTMLSHVAYSARPNILFIMVDDLGADVLSWLYLVSGTLRRFEPEGRRATGP